MAAPAVGKIGGTAIANVGKVGGATKARSIMDVGQYLDVAASTYFWADDTAGTSITGDIDIRWEGALDDWSRAVEQTLCSKWNSFGVNYREWRFGLSTGGVPYLVWSTNGTATTTSNCSVAVTTVVPDGARIRLRVTLDVDDGASQKVVKFYYSLDFTTALTGSTGWTQLGSTNTTSGTTSIANSSGRLTIGALVAGVTDLYAAVGKHRAMAVLSGIDGTPVCDLDLSNPAHVAVGGTTATDSYGNSFAQLGSAVVTANRRATKIATTPLAFDPTTAISWKSCFWAEGRKFGVWPADAAIPEWKDETEAWHVVQGTAANRPLYRAAGLNSKPSVEFDGTDDRLQYINSSADQAEPLSYVFVMKYDNADTNTRALFGDGDTRFPFYTNGGSWYGHGGTVIGTDDGNIHLWTLYASNGSTDIIEKDGTVTNGPGNLLAAAHANGWTVGCEPTLANMWDGHLAFLGLYSGDVRSATNWQEFEDWVERHYGITVA